MRKYAKRTMAIRWAGAFLLVGFFSTGACIVRQVYLKPGYETNERERVKRIVLVLRHAKRAQPPGVVAVVPVVAREFISVQRDYILYPGEPVASANLAVADICASNKKLNGVLLLEVLQARENEGNVDLEVAAALEDCRAPYSTIWKALARSTYTSEDPDLRTVIASYANRLGPAVRPFAAPAYLLVRRLLEELPSPTLSDDEKLEKIDVME